MDKEGLRIIPVTKFSASTASEFVDAHLNATDIAHQLNLKGAEYFGSGQVYSIIIPDTDGVKGAVWMEDASVTHNITNEDDLNCANPHKHHGERILFSYTGARSVLIVMSYEPLIIDNRFQLDWKIPVFEQKHSISGRTEYFALIPPGAEVLMRFAPGVSHGFFGIGKTYTLAVHPDEAAEITRTQQAPNLNLQTEWLGKAPLNCKAVASDIRRLQEQKFLPEFMVELIQDYVKPSVSQLWKITASIAAAVGMAFFSGDQQHQYSQTLAEKYCGKDMTTLAIYDENIGGFEYYTFPRAVIELAERNPTWEAFNKKLDQLNIPTPPHEFLVPDDIGNDKIAEYQANPRKETAFHYVQHNDDRGFDYTAGLYIERDQETVEREFFSLLKKPHIVVDQSDPKLAYLSTRAL